MPSASLGAKDKNGNMRSMYEPVHGSAPDIAGKNLANPIATILSFSMALRYSLNLEKEAKELDTAVQEYFNDGIKNKRYIFLREIRKFQHLKWEMQLLQNCKNK